MSLKRFNELLQFPTYHLISGCTTRWRPDPIWLNITCSKHKTYINRLERPRIYDPRQAKATDICNLNIRYLQRLIATVIFGHNDIRNVCKKSKLFLIWFAFLGTHEDTSLSYLAFVGDIKDHP